jgi:hypothetical protein
MHSSIRKVSFILVFPILIYFIAGYPLIHFTHRDQYLETKDPASKPLNLRYFGYNPTAAIDYWTWLQKNNGLIAEQNFLKADLFFPFFYGGAMLTSLFFAWVWINRRLNQILLIMPVAIMVVADWTENLVHLRQLGRFVNNEPVESGWIQVASIATTTKWAFLVLSSLVILSLAIRVARHSDKA